MAKKEIKKDNNLVTYELFQDDGKYSDDVTLGLNGVFTKIQRGVEVQITKDQREILEHSKHQKASTTRLIKGMERDFLQKNI